MKLFCNSCKAEYKFYSSKHGSNANSVSLFNINIRLVCALRSIGKGSAGGELFCGVMNLPPPPTKFGPYVEVLLAGTEYVCKQTMKEAVEEAVVINDGCRDITVALDGSWQKRGHTSQNGLVTATSVDTGKVVDVEVFSKYCRCEKKLLTKHSSTCIANYTGTSGGMEVSGVVKIFSRSKELYDVRYVQYLGDGDSKGYKAVVALQPYGESVNIEKLECIGHIQKRMGARLMKLKASKRGEKLDDGKSIGGRNRLTDSLIVDIQRYYGLAIRRNVKNLEDMQKAVWAVYFHLLSSNDQPQHGLCPKGQESWCKYQKAEAVGDTSVYDHKKHKHVTSSVMTAIKPIFRDLADPSLLVKCIHGKTQNPNESVNSVIWKIVPKTVFIQLHTLMLGVKEAVSHFNMGYFSKCLILEMCGVKPGDNCVSAMQKLDSRRVVTADRKFLNVQKEARTRRYIGKKKLEALFEAAENPDEPSYGSGMY